MSNTMGMVPHSAVSGSGQALRDAFWVHSGCLGIWGICSTWLSPCPPPSTHSELLNHESPSPTSPTPVEQLELPPPSPSHSAHAVSPFPSHTGT